MPASTSFNTSISSIHTSHVISTAFTLLMLSNLLFSHPLYSLTSGFYIDYDILPAAYTSLTLVPQAVIFLGTLIYSFYFADVCIADYDFAYAVCLHLRISFCPCFLRRTAFNELMYLRISLCLCPLT